MAGDPRPRAFDLVVVGTSWGGLQALGTLLEGLPPRFGLPIVVAQHRAPDSSTILVRLLQARSSLVIREASDKDELQPGCVYIAPPDYHLLVERGTVALSTEEAVRYSRPSIDVMFESAADAYGERLVGVILTGANDDGALGLKRIRDGGGAAVVQDPASAERREMPEAAIAAVASAKVLPLEEIGSFMGQVCSAGMS